MQALDKMVGKEIIDIGGLRGGSEAVVIYHGAGQFTVFFHIQDCCEHVSLEDFEGDERDFVGSRVLSAECVMSKDDTDDESATWTFYKIETTKGGLWFRWYGESNGYYSEEVNVFFIDVYNEEKPVDCDEFVYWPCWGRLRHVQDAAEEVCYDEEVIRKLKKLTRCD